MIQWRGPVNHDATTKRRTNVKYDVKNKATVWAWRDDLFAKSSLTIDDLFEIDEYRHIVNNPSNIAFQRWHAETVIDTIDDFGSPLKFSLLRQAMVSRIKICEAQGDFSQSQKRKKQAER